jgi:hypothetical protein
MPKFIEYMLALRLSRESGSASPRSRDDERAGQWK